MSAAQWMRERRVVELGRVRAGVGAHRSDADSAA